MSTIPLIDLEKTLAKVLDSFYGDDHSLGAIQKFLGNNVLCYDVCGNCFKWGIVVRPKDNHPCHCLHCGTDSLSTTPYKLRLDTR